jgi:glycerol uptake facilitator-like aquaporin
MSNKGNSDWRYALVPIIGPLIAGAIGAAIIKVAGIR